MSIRLFYLRDPENYNYASAVRRGTWYPLGEKICPECQRSRQKRIPPLIIEWEPGSNVVGDFTWPGFNTDLVVSQRVREQFEKHFHALEFWSVEFWQSPKLKKPTKMTNRSLSRIWLPYEGPTLWDVILNSWCHLDHLRSGISIEKICSVCKRVVFNYPIQRQGNLVVDPSTWSGEDIFHIHEYPGGVFCTERARELIFQAGFTNVGFAEDGIIPDK